jgi:hypothetical protein
MSRSRMEDSGGALARQREYNRDAQRRFRERRRQGETVLDLTASASVDLSWNPRILEHGSNWDCPKSLDGGHS